jgi:hypothetical protein
MPSAAPIKNPARRPRRRMSIEAGMDAVAVPTNMAAIGNVARPLSGASTAPRMPASVIDITTADSASAWLVASNATLR